MFALRAAATEVSDKENQEEQSEDLVKIGFEDVSVKATVETKQHDLLNNDDAFLEVLAELKRKAKKKDEELHASVDIAAKVGVSGNNPEAVSSAVKTASFLFEHLLSDLESLASKGISDKHDREREEMVESFHTHMTEALQQFSQTSAGMRKLEGDFSTAAGVMDQSAEEYIASIRSVIKKEVEDSVTAWYRNVKYDAYVPAGAVGSGDVITIGTILYGATIGAVINGFKSIAGMCSSAGDNGYERLNGEGMIEHGKRRKPVLKDLTGKLEAGRLTLVIGPPGCGKTSYLRAISGNLHRQKGVSAKISGEIRYNFTLVEDLKKLANWSTFVSQLDDHLPLLTVRETFEFAHRCRKETRMQDDRVYNIMAEKIGREAAERIRALTLVEVDFILAVLGLSNCADTIIGNATLKGVSGGEKRRVTLGEMLITGAQVACLDEISTGLDSAATYDICKYLRSTAHFLNQVVVVSLLQPPPEVVDLFDDVVLLAEGNVIYHGPRESVLDYFEKLGYRKPVRKDLGDFLAELPTASGVDFLLPENERPSGYVPRTADEFGAAWKNSEEGKKMEADVAAEAQKQYAQGEAIAREGDPLASLTWDDMPENSIFRELWIVLGWSWTLKMRNTAQIFAKIFQNLFMGLIFGSLFWQIGFDEWYLKAMLFAQMPSFMQSGGIGSVTQLVQERRVFYKQNEAKFYKGFTFAAAQFIVQVPFTVFDAMVFGNLLYWMCGLVHDAERYMTFMLLAILFGICVNQMMRVFAYSQRTEAGAFVCAVMAYLMFIIFSGQVATPKVIPDYLIWLFWMNPLAWVYRALAINEFKADYYSDNPCTMTMNTGGEERNISVPQRCGDFYLENRQFETGAEFVPYAGYVLVGYIILFQALTVYCLTYVRFDRSYTEAEEKDEEKDAGQQDARVGMAQFGRTESLAVSLKTLVFSDLWYTINLGASTDSENNTIDLLKGVNGWALPGRMTALMGSSGAGKTTLLDVLADRKTTGEIRGHILVNSAPPDPKTFRKIVGYVEQFGVHAKCATVKESLKFSAGLRLPAKAAHRVETFVEETLDLLELTSIGDELTASLSVEENKRLTIAVELVANPSILFADEPTSGLDARAAQIVMRSIQNVARSGRTVICTIHQPSVAVFTMFDDLLLMRRGGKVVFFGELGENAKNLISYFEAIPGTTPCPVGYNPATWMLEVIGAGTGESKDALDYANVYSKSKLCQYNQERLKYEFMAPSSADEPLSGASYLASVGRDGGNLTGGSAAMFSGGASSRALFSPPSGSGGSGVSTDLQNMATPMKRKYYHQKQQSMRRKMKGESAVPATSTSYRTQLLYLLRRNQLTYWRSPEFSLSRLMVILFVGVIITSIFWQQEYKVAAETQSRISAISFMVMLAGAYNLFTIMPFQMEKRALFYREVSSGMYSKLAAVTSDGIVEIPYLIVETIIGVNVVYWGVGFQADFESWIFYSVVFFLYIFLMTMLGMLFASLMPDVLSAQLIAGVFVQVFQIFAGLMVPYDKLPSYYKFLYYFSPQMWCQEALITTQFHNDDTLICDPSGKIINDAAIPQFNNKACNEDGHFDRAAFMARNFTGVVKTAEDYVYGKDDSFLGYDYSNRYYDIVVVFCWIVMLRVITTIIVIKIDHNKR